MERASFILLYLFLYCTSGHYPSLNNENLYLQQIIVIMFSSLMSRCESEVTDEFDIFQIAWFEYSQSKNRFEI